MPLSHVTVSVWTAPSRNLGQQLKLPAGSLFAQFLQVCKLACWPCLRCSFLQTLELHHNMLAGQLPGAWAGMNLLEVRIRMQLQLL